jgi:hypothetical protein
VAQILVSHSRRRHPRAVARRRPLPARVRGVGAAYGFLSFEGASGPDAEPALVRDRGRVEVRIRASTVFTMRDDVVDHPLDIGLVAVGCGTTSDFDDLVVRS